MNDTQTSGETFTEIILRRDAEIAQLRQELAEEKQWRQETVTPFLEWAQAYLYAGRWAGHSMFDAIKTELVERDSERDQLRVDASVLAESLGEAGVDMADWAQYAGAYYIERHGLEDDLKALGKVLSEHGSRYLQEVTK